MAKSTLAARAAAITKSLLSATAAQPKTIQMPKAISQIHVGPSDDEVIPAGTIITDEIAEIAGLDADDMERLEAAGHVEFVDVYASPAAEPKNDATQADAPPAA